MSRRILFELKEIDATDITTAYVDFGLPTENPCIVADFINTSDVEFYISIDGVDNILRLPAGGTATFDTKNIKDHADTSVYIFGAKVQLQIKLQNPNATGTWGDVYCNMLTITLD